MKLMVAAGLISRLAEFLRSSGPRCLQFGAAWALTNVLAESSEQTRAVVEGGAVQLLDELLSSPHVNVCKHAVFALGNIAGETLPSGAKKVAGRPWGMLWESFGWYCGLNTLSISA